MRRRNLVQAVGTLGASAVAGYPATALAALTDTSGFVTKSADGALRRGGRPFRYIGANMPEVTHIRTDWDLEQGARFRLPTPDEIDWMVEAAAQMNLKVIRTWCFPSHLQPELPAELHYLRPHPDGRTVSLDEKGFRLFDHFLWRCRQHGVLAQVPFVYLYKARQWADAAGDPHPQLLDAVRKVTGRINTRTGVAYRDDPTIFAWESGNEAKPTARWIVRLAAFVKSVAPRQLFMDGRWGASDILESYQDAALAANREIDLVSVHTYEERPGGRSSAEAIARLATLMRAQGRALDVGEIGPATTLAELAEILATVIREPVAGASWWSFKGARAKGGYTQWNGREWGGNDDLKWPGFVSSLSGVSVEKAKVDLLCDAAHMLDGRRRPRRLPPPTSAKLLPISDVGHISWIPGTGEQVADIARSTGPGMDFKTIVAEFETFKASTHDLFCDTTAEIGQTYYYRVRSRNSGGVARWSNVVGPVVATSGWLVDDFWDTDRMLGRSDHVSIESSYDLIPYHCDLSVLKASRDGQYLIYRVPGRIASVFLLSNDDTRSIALDARADDAGWREIATERTLYSPLHPEFAGHPRIGYRAALPQARAFTDLRIRLGARDVLSRLEIEYVRA